MSALQTLQGGLSSTIDCLVRGGRVILSGQPFEFRVADVRTLVAGASHWRHLLTFLTSD